MPTPAEVTAATRLLIRRDTAVNLAAVNPLLGPGEPVKASDTGVLKVGDGTRRWLDLPAHLEVSGVTHIQRITRADYDALPTPRPSDTLYIITPL